MIEADVERTRAATGRSRCTVPEGSLLNPLPPAAVSVRHPTSLKVADLMLKALLRGQAGAQRGAGCSVSFPTFNATGIDPRTGEPYLCADIVGGGMGGARSRRRPLGDRHAPRQLRDDVRGGHGAGVPLRVLKTELVPDSGGAGTYRGGLAVERWYELLAPEALMGGHYADQTLEETRPWGLDGGSRGRPAAVFLNPGRPDERHMRGKEVDYEVVQGDVLVLRSSGGGGWGPPGTRDRAALARDVRDGYVTAAGALRDYGVDIGEESDGR